MLIHSLAHPDSQVPSFVEAWANREEHELKHLNVSREEIQLPHLWEVDLLLLFGWENITDEAGAPVAQWVMLLEKCGRPIFHGSKQAVLTEEHLHELSLKPRTNYRPVDCGYYDHFEAAIVKRQSQPILLKCFEKRDTDNLEILHLLGTKTWRKEEYVEVEHYGWMRADWVDLVDVRLSGNCSTDG